MANRVELGCNLGPKASTSAVDVCAEVEIGLEMFVS